MEWLPRVLTNVLAIRDEKGVTAIEYGLIASLVAVVIITAVTLIGTNLSSVFNTIATKL
jgi:pilus assembly protein Flp/PilA